jgi:predicted acetyltransferase
MDIDIRALGPERHGDFVAPIGTAFGLGPIPERIEAMKRVPELDVRLAAFEGDLLVGAVGAFNFRMMTAGGPVPVSGVTMVAVLPTHRRRGVLSRLLRRQADDARARGQAVAALFASESSIYGRFGYGVASQCCGVSIERARAALVPCAEPPWRARPLGEAEALAVFPGIYERVRQGRPGMLSRSEAWWEVRRLRDWERDRASKGLLQRVAIEIEGRPEAYALYRTLHQWDAANLPCGALTVVEAVGATPIATRLVWRYLLEVDLMERIEAPLLPVDHPLQHLLVEPRRLRATVGDALWVRLVDVEAALSARSYAAEGAVTFEVEDASCPWNAGRYRLDGGAGRAARTDAPAEIRLDVAALGSAYLGGVSLRQLADAGRIEERAPGAVDRADALFRSPRAPWCPEIF